MKTVVAFLFVAVPKVISGAGQFLLNLFLIRRMGPAVFGTLAVCLSAILLCDSFLGSAIDMGLLRLAPTYEEQGNHTRSLRVQQAGLFLKPAAVAIVGIPAIALSGWVSQLLFQRPDLGYMIPMTVAALGSLLVLRSVQTYFQVAHRFSFYGGADLAHNILRYGSVAIVGLSGSLTPAFVLAVYSIAPIVVAGTLLAGPARELFSGGLDWSAARELGGVLAWFVPAAAVGGLTTRMDVFFVSGVGGVRQAGIFTAAQAVCVPLLLLGSYLSVVFGPRIMPDYHRGTLDTFYRRFQLWIGAFAVAGYLLLVATLGFFSHILFPPTFQASARVLIVLLPAMLAGLVNFPLTISVLLFLRPKLVFSIDACAIPVLALAYYAVIPAYGAVGAAFVTATYALVKLGILQTAAWRLVIKPDSDAAASPQLGFSEGF